LATASFLQESCYIYSNLFNKKIVLYLLKKTLTFVLKVVYSRIVFRKKPCAQRNNGNYNKKRSEKSMRKLISLALCLTLAMAITAGCKKQEEAPAPEATPAPAPEQQQMSTAAPAEAPAAPAEAPAAPEKK
jgi:hypothetical protein